MAAGKTVLIVDDDPQYRQLIGEILEHNGWTVVAAGDGEEAVRLARHHKPDAVLCDLLMPGENGFAVCRNLRAEPFLRETKIIVTSGRDYASDRQAAFAAGADDYLTKPVKGTDLLAVLSGRPRPARPSPARSEAPVRESSDISGPAWLKFWGVRGSIPTPGPTTLRYGGNTSCIEVRADGQLIILDGGTGLRPLGRALTDEFGHRPLELTLLLTHTHWDHIQGLPFFLPVYNPQIALRILGYEGARHGLDNVLTSQMESPFFPIGLREVPANVSIEELKEMEFNIGPVRVKASFANHPGICVGYRLFTSAGSIAFFPDNEPHSGHRHGADAAAGDTSSLEYARVEDQKTADFLRDVDVLIMDAQYDAEEYEQHRGWGHGCVDDVVALAMQAGVKRLFLFHHDPEHDDEAIDHMVAQARHLVAAAKGTLRVDAAKEGATVALGALEFSAVPSPP